MEKQLQHQLAYGLERMGLHFSSPMQKKLLQYVGLIVRWNKTFNLTAIRNVEAMVNKHLLDSLVVQPYLDGQSILDVGSGAGLPGIPFAITSPDKHFVLNDSNGKKTRFLMQAKIDLKLDNVEVVHRRVQDFCPELDGHRIYFDVITARAYATTDEILHSTSHLQDNITRVLVMQGKLDKRIENNLYQLADWHALDVYGLSAERHLLEITKRSTHN